MDSIYFKGIGITSGESKVGALVGEEFIRVGNGSLSKVKKDSIQICTENGCVPVSEAIKFIDAMIEHGIEEIDVEDDDESGAGNVGNEDDFEDEDENQRLA